MEKKDEVKICCICGREYTGWGNNPWPIVNEEGAQCCDECNSTYVLMARMRNIVGAK